VAVASATARGQLEGFLTNIQGADLADKIDSLNKFYSMDSDLLNKLQLDDKGPGGKISSVLAYLVFYKTLTKILTNFNAASAGFNFEAFLAVMLGGKQVPTNSNTIADLYDSKGTPISLKLYAEDGVEVGGSYRDLIKDLAKEAGYMQYIVCMKSLKAGADGSSAVGSIKFYRFNFNLKNVVNILASSSKASKRNIILPGAYISDKVNVAIDLPVGGVYPSPQEAEAEFILVAREKIEEAELHKFLGSINYEELFKKLDFARAKDIWDGKGEPTHGYTSLGQTKVVNKIINLFPDNRRAEVKELALVLQRANDKLRERYSHTSAQLKRTAAIRDAYLSGPDDELINASKDAYNALQSDEERVIALQQTLGYVGSTAQNVGHFNMTGRMVTRVHELDPSAIPPGGSSGATSDVPAFIGEIKIGADELQKMLDQVITVLNKSVFDIFSNLQLLTTSIKTYFAAGMSAKVEDQARNAITAADNIESKTKEISGVDS